jgi:hypothetical protein
MILRNWWIEGRMDGQKTLIGTGPRSKSGGFSLTIKQRVEGESQVMLRIQGEVRGRDAKNPVLALLVTDDKNKVLAQEFSYRNHRDGETDNG